MKPNFIGVGAQKCASTWVHRVLQDHPQAWVSEPKELDFFTYHYDHGYQWYAQHFAGAGAATAVGEISPSYLCDVQVPERARRYNPDFRVIVTLRDPVERAYSNHLHEVRVGHFTGEDLSFERGLANNDMYVEQSRYARHLKNWLACFPADRVLVLLQEEIAVDAAAQARRVYEFLGIDVDHQSEFLNKRVNESAAVKSKKLDQAFKRAGHLARSLGLETVVRMAKTNALVAHIREANKQDLRAVVPPMSAETRRLLLAQLRDDVLELADLLGRPDLPWKSWRDIKQPLSQGIDSTVECRICAA